MEKKPNQNPKAQKKQPTSDLLKYSGMAFQMFIIMGLGTYGGIKLDEYFENEKIPVYTLLLALFSAAVAIYLFIKDVIRKK